MMKIFEVKINRDAYQYHKERLIKILDELDYEYNIDGWLPSNDVRIEIDATDKVVSMLWREAFINLNEYRFLFDSVNYPTADKIELIVLY